MKKIVLTYGLISGVLIATFTVCSIAYCYASKSFEGNMLLGYAAMIMAFSLVFVGVKNVRDKENNGIISFGNAFKIGLYIALIASSVYVLAWVVEYYLFFPDFLEKFSEYSLKEIKASGASQTEIASKTAEMEGYKGMYSNPFGVILLTYMEILPVGLIVSLISALILKQK